VESSFNLNAYSKFGASGIWQFTRSTGKQFLTIDYAVDERQDPIRASHAAAKFLKKITNALAAGHLLSQPIIMALQEWLVRRKPMAVMNKFSPTTKKDISNLHREIFTPNI